jgi:hypothetical protein
MGGVLWVFQAGVSLGLRPLLATPSPNGHRAPTARWGCGRAAGDSAGEPGAPCKFQIWGVGFRIRVSGLTSTSRFSTVHGGGIMAGRRDRAVPCEMYVF